MEHTYLHRIIALYITIILSGCATSVGNRTSFENTRFVVGETQQQEVAKVLGLPSEISHSEGLLLWGYPEAPELSGLIVAIPTGSNVVSTYAIDTASEEGEFNQSQMIYAFDEDGILRQVSDQRQKKEKE
ncbi:hypothetical protein JF541_16115 [Marinobacter hydrocarbonoclasticus]|jgi:hypothetical protein|uniref:hypothetical protein n=1 Tax=Marinobacter TaxID=2742 RepID=UPI001A8EADEE|nr:hypothetical protein [Marinobacter nauticus]MBN8240686.1 hypothetical protein [Marinobacter nauticus]|tara:strand:+ start:831 stop:1220 length:390 start_codon:yes stop_codon:yes gene_type:complete